MGEGLGGGRDTTPGSSRGPRGMWDKNNVCLISMIYLRSNHSTVEKWPRDQTWLAGPHDKDALETLFVLVLYACEAYRLVH